MRVGFTGTRHGCTASQLILLRQTLHRLPITEFHHGDCVGADAQAHELVRAPIHIHPSDGDQRLRAFCKTGNIAMVYPPMLPLVRNRIIVDMTELLIAGPAGIEEELRSGTWSTIRYARRQRKKICILFPDGTKLLENHT